MVICTLWSEVFFSHFYLVGLGLDEGLPVLEGILVKVLITGGKGQLGSELAKLLEVGGLPCVSPNRAELDITDSQALKAALDGWTDGQPVTSVVHAAALTQVDLCETEWERAWAVNAVATQQLAQLCAERRLPLIYLSTDYIFDGAKDSPYEVEDQAAPLNVYGFSKLAGEDAVRRLIEHHYIVRTARVFSAWGCNFPRTILQAAMSGRPLRVVNDQVGSPTSAKDLAEVVLTLLGIEFTPDGLRLARMGNRAPYGTYHVTNTGHCSWWTFAQEILSQAGWRVNIEPISSTDLQRSARRPAYSVLSLASMAGVGLMTRRWQEALSDFLPQLQLISPELFPNPKAMRHSVRRESTCRHISLSLKKHPSEVR